jgi:hypothetical protein
MTPVDAVAAAVVGQIRRVVIDGAGVVIDLGRKQRLFTGAARDAVMLLTSGCRYAGCDQPPTRCQVDHIQEWAHGGRTEGDGQRGAAARPTQPLQNQNRLHHPPTTCSHLDHRQTRRHCHLKTTV